jgi:cation diffusion facilitator CzcD-associated flavoprotein CzcO
MKYFDILIIGAGLSGIGAAVHLRRECPDKSLAILEARERLGGTWDLFNYPGVRSDSDMHTLGFRFKPWEADKAIADGPSILAYLKETAREYDIERHIRYNHKMVRAAWSSEQARWTIKLESGETLSCNFLYMCSGYYNYAAGYTPNFKAIEAFNGQIIHPQLWDPKTEYAGKDVVVIGSGATAVTLVPAMTDTARSVTMLQRSPGYLVARPAVDKGANLLRALIPKQWAYNITRAKNVKFQSWLYKFTQSKPKLARKILLRRTQKALGKDHDLSRDFSPSYYPWDERLCLVPDGDFFEAIKAGAARVKTGHIEKFEAGGIRLENGEFLSADIIITATGLDVQIFGGASFEVDGDAVDFSTRFSYEGMMFSGVPNMVNIFGYVNASWTLRLDIVSDWVCRLLRYMSDHQHAKAVPIAPKDMEMRPWFNFLPGYIRRAEHFLPRQGDREPWLHAQDYLRDKRVLAAHPINDGVLHFSASLAASREDGPAAAQSTARAQ